ncbi:AAA family ATPase [Solirubrobacter sp. CPCC 204708]|uniref:LuxR family transcriptional regulator n=1 Tax=Solirubrobacter deserti TaxID=2282478 RepID=A0ABT4RS06_9ACTN|nr:LuxR family transcriptional regulator [Solirubrobacter deserti]MBE2318726.1 AAA family ATPase [Solirubrobacter deserti]MDA0141316.1 LuxR family transcriptional regulator [Solirubrobacter deserti]
MQDDLIERDAERAALDEALAAAVSGTGRLIVIEAAPGLGKTRLLKTLHDAPGRVLRARGSELEATFAFGVVHQLLDAVVLASPDTVFEGAARLAQPIFSEARPEQEDLLPLLHGLAWLVTGLAAERPLILLVDDAQWADEPSRRFLAFLAKRIDGVPLLLAVATRPAHDDPALSELISEPDARVLRPRGLTEDGTRAFLARAELDPALAASCHASTGGNPFYLGELARELPAPNPTALGPRAVAEAVKRRLDREALALARAVAVLGDGTDLAATFAGVEDPDAATRRLVSAGVLEPDLTFAHPIVRSAIYADIPAAERAAAHARAAALLASRHASPERLAAHLLEAPPAHDPATVATLRHAARRARELGGASSAAAYLTRALREPPPADQRAEVLTELGAAEARAGHAAATEHLEQAIELAADEPARTRAAIELARVLKFRGESVRAVPILERRHADGPLGEELEIERLGLAYLSVAARAAIRRSLTDPGGVPRTRLEAFTLAALAFDAGARGDHADTVADLATRALAGELLPPDPLGGGYAYLIIGVALMWADRLDEAAQLYANLRAEARRQGSVVLLATAAGQSALVNERRGALPEAAADAAEALALGREATGTEALLNSARASAVTAALERGEAVDETVLDGEPDTMPYMLVLHARAEARAARGDLPGAIADFRACGAYGQSWGGENPSVSAWRSRAATLLTDLGEYDEAHALVREELKLARAFGAPRAIGVALCVAGTIGAQPPLPALKEAVAVLEETPARLELARALVSLGSALRRGGQRAAAREPLARGLDLATRCGAAPLVRRAHEELLAAGARPRRIALSGRDALTPSERRVAELAASGLTNRGIAQQLFVTEKTVEAHLRGAFQKLEISSRTRLAQVLA